MLKFIKNLYQKQTRGYSDEDAEFMNRLIRGDKAFDILDNTSNLLGNFMDAESGRSAIAKDIIHASDRTVSEVGFKGGFLELFDLNATATIREAGIAAERFAEQLYTDKDQRLSRMSDAYSLIAVLCYGRLGKYRSTSDQQIYEMAAQLFGAVTAAHSD